MKRLLFQIGIDYNCFHIHEVKQTKMVIVFINGIFIKTTIIILLTTEKSYNVSVPMSVYKCLRHFNERE